MKFFLTLFRIIATVILISFCSLIATFFLSIVLPENVQKAFERVPQKVGNYL